jgi:hypothetical protein
MEQMTIFQTLGDRHPHRLHLHHLLRMNVDTVKKQMLMVVFVMSKSIH